MSSARVAIAKRGPKGVAGAATILALAALWVLAASLLWRSRVPHDLRLPHVDPRAWFSAAELARTQRYERFVRIDLVLALLAPVAALAVFARKGAAFTRESVAGPVGTGMFLGMLGMAFAWLAQLPFALAGLWWERRHGVSRLGYPDWLLQSWLGLAGTFLFVCLAILIVMGLARSVGRLWWLAAGPAFVGLAVLFAFLQPYLLAPSTHPIRQPEVAAAARELARAEGLPGTKVVVQDVHSDTSAANAFAAGLGPSRRVVLWDTLLDGRFSLGEIRVVLAHELGHLARNHIWKGLAWYALFAIPGAFLVALATRRRGGLTQPAAVPLAIFVIALLQLVALPVQNLITRRIEAEADWMALQTTRDPRSAEGLFARFSTTSLIAPRPPTWAYLLLADHPTIVQRIAMAEAWRARHRP
jgi:STE24 endopeptidase